MLFRSDDLILDTDAARMPIIGYDNKVTAVNVTSTTEEADFPITNVANPLTHLKWVGGVNTAGVETITISGLSGAVSYLSIVRHNLGTIGASVTVTTNPSLESSIVSLLHFDGIDGSTTFTDEIGKIWTPNSNAQIDTSLSKFGGASGFFDGTSDYLTGNGSTDFAFGTGDFTIDFWIRRSNFGNQMIIYDSRPTGTNGVYPTIYIRSDDVLVYFVNSTDRITGTSIIGTDRWYHVALTRSGTSTRLFLNGTQEGSTYSDSNIYLNGTSRPIIAADGTNTAGEFLGRIDELRVIKGVAVWTANFTPPIVPYGFLFGADVAALLHFDSVDGATTFTDETGKIWSASGNVQIDTAQSKFGGGSALFDGIGDVLTGNGSADFAFGTGDFTIDFWVRLNSVGTQKILYDSRPGVEGIYPTIYIGASNVLIYRADSSDRITGTTSLITGQWYHVALTRLGTNTRLFLDGTQEGSTFGDNFTYLNGTDRPSLGGETHNGWIDELRIIKGAAAWTANFTPPTAPYGNTITDDSPIIFQFNSEPVTTITIQITSTTAPEIAVIYLGDLLTLERSIVPDAPHVPINLGRRTKTVQGRSTSGNYLGSIVLSESRESLAQFMWFDEDWYRANFDPFVVAAQEIPFVFAWNPAEMPEDVGYCWLVEDPMPEFDPVSRRVGVDLKMQGVA